MNQLALSIQAIHELVSQPATVARVSVPVLLPVPPASGERYLVPITKLVPALWPEVQARYAGAIRHRRLARRYDVSHEANRGIIQRKVDVAFGLPTSV